jgi:hypothetical protein
MDYILLHPPHRFLCLFRCKSWSFLYNEVARSISIPYCRSSSSSCTSSSSRAAIRLFRLSYIVAGSTGVRSFFFLAFWVGCVPFTAGAWFGGGFAEAGTEGLAGADCVVGGGGGAGPAGGGLAVRGMAVLCELLIAPFIAMCSLALSDPGAGFRDGKQQRSDCTIRIFDRARRGRLLLEPRAAS